MNNRNTLGYVLSIPGAGLVFAECAIATYTRTSPNLWIVGIGLLFTFGGAWIVNDTKAESFADSVTEHFSPFTRWLPSGRRTTDPVIPVEDHNVPIPPRPKLTDHDEGDI